MRFRTLITVSCAVAALDQAAKALFGKADAPLVPGLIRLRGAFNTGAAFGTMQGSAGLLAALSALAVAGGCFLLHRLKPAGALALGAALMLGGAAGNLIDRITRGGVVDFLLLEFVPFPAFNVADAAITAGAVLLAASLLRRGEGAPP